MKDEQILDEVIDVLKRPFISNPSRVDKEVIHGMSSLAKWAESEREKEVLKQQVRKEVKRQLKLKGRRC